MNNRSYPGPQLAFAAERVLRNEGEWLFENEALALHLVSDACRMNRRAPDWAIKAAQQSIRMRTDLANRRIARRDNALAL